MLVLSYLFQNPVSQLIYHSHQSNRTHQSIKPAQIHQTGTTPTMAPQPDLLLYTYPFSPYGRRITHYLTLRQIPHTTVEQPAVLPRPDLENLGIQYRRIPLLAIGKDIYCDTKAILKTLEERFPSGKGGEAYPGISATDATGKTLEKLFQTWSTSLVFENVFGLIPAEAPALTDPTVRPTLTLFALPAKGR